METKIIDELNHYIYHEKNYDKASEIYNGLDDKYKQKMIYNFSNLTAYLVFAAETFNKDLLNDLLEFMDENIDNYTKYEKYVYYYFYAVYFVLEDFNIKAALFTLNLIDMKKFRKYLDYEYKEYLLGLILETLGYIVCQMNDYKKAQEYMIKSKKVFIELGSNKRAFGVEIGLADIYLRQGKLKQSGELLYKAFKEVESINYSILMYLSFLELFKHNYKKAFIYYNMIDMNQLNISSPLIVYQFLNPIKYLGSILHYQTGQKEKANEIFSTVKLDSDYVRKNELYDYKIVQAYITEDYAEETYNFIKDKVYPLNYTIFLNAKNFTCDLYFDAAEKHINKKG